MRNNRIFQYSIKGHISIDEDLREYQQLEGRTLYKNILFSIFESMDSSFTKSICHLLLLDRTK